MKKFISFLIIFLLVNNTIGLFVVFKIKQSVIKKEIKSSIKSLVPESELSIIIVSKENNHLVEWKDEHEFRYNGTMYDVVRKYIIDERTTQYYCINDQQETQLFSNLDNLVKNEMNGKQKSNSTLKLVFSFYAVQLIKDRSLLYADQHQTGSYAEYMNYYNSPFLSISSPPPEFS